MFKPLLTLSLLVLCLHSYAQNIVADYTFDNGVAADHSGNGLNGTIYGGVIPVAGHSGIPNTALKFDGSTGFVMVPSSPLLNLTSWTISAYVKFSDFYSGTCQVNALIVHGTEDGPDFYRLCVLDNEYNSCNDYDPTKETIYASAAGTPSSEPSTSFLDTTTWHNLVATYGNDSVKVYLDGSLTSSVYWVNNYNYTQNVPLYIGRYTDIAYPYWFNGIMDRVTIWDGPLSDSAIVDWSSNPDSTTAVANIASSVHKYRIYPVPATSVLNIPVSGKDRQLQVSISNMYGQQVYRQTLTAGAGNEAKIPISELKSGNYILTIIDDNGRSVEPFTKL